MPKKISVGLVLDESGSMAPLREATISGVNEYVADLDPAAVLTITMFSSQRGDQGLYREFCKNAKAADVPKLTGKTYFPGGNTPLLDAIGHTITEMDGTKGTVLFVIQTDGQENASREFSRDKIVELIQEREKKGWKFIYLGANQDQFTAERAAQAMGMMQGAGFVYEGGTTGATYSSLGAATATVAANPTMTSAQVTQTVQVVHDKKTKATPKP